MEYTDEKLEQIVYGDAPEFEPVTDENMESGGRWNNYFDQTFITPEGKFIMIQWDRGATEYQDEGMENITWNEVFPKEITRTVYVMKEQLADVA